MSEKNLSLFKVFMSQDVMKPLEETLFSGFITQGPRVEEFEQKLKTFFDYPYLLTLNCATSGLVLSLRLIKDKLGMTNDDEVLATPLTCMATNIPIMNNGLKIKWVDVDPKTCLIDLDDLKSKITQKTKAIIFVHWGGMPVDLDRLSEILDEKEKDLGFRPLVVEDCAHSFMAEYKGKKIGTHGNFAVISLQAIKQMTTVDGGVLFLPNEELYNKAKLLRWYGIDRDKRNYKREDFRLEHDVEEWGYKFHMNDVNATIGIHQLPHIPNLIKKNRENADFLDTLLGNHLPDVEICHKSLDYTCRSAYWLYTVLLPSSEPKKLQLIDYMKQNGVMISQVHQRNDVHTVFADFKAPLPNLDLIERRMVCVPVGWWLERDDLEYIVNKIVEFYKQ
jgi:UDP-glucose 4,6-dehydratase